MKWVEALGLEAEREHCDDRLLDRPRRPGPREGHPPAVIGHVLVAIHPPHDVGLLKADLRRDPDVGEAVVHEGHVVEDVLTRCSPEDVDAKPGRPDDHFLGERQLVGRGRHRFASSASRLAMFSLTSWKWRSMAAATASGSPPRSASSTGGCRSADHCGSAPGMTSVM